MSMKKRYGATDEERKAYLIGYRAGVAEFYSRLLWELNFNKKVLDKRGEERTK